MRWIRCALLFAGLAAAIPASAQTPSPYFITDPRVGGIEYQTAPTAAAIAAGGPDVLRAEETSVGGSCGPQMGWFGAEWLLYRIKKASSPPLISGVSGTLPANAQLTADQTYTLFPSEGKIDYGNFNGLRLNGGIWLTPQPGYGIDFSGFFLEQRSKGAAIASDGNPPLTLGYTSSNNPSVQSFLLIADPRPGGSTGTQSGTATANSIYGADLNFRWTGYRYFSDSAEYMTGFRYFDFRERLALYSRADFQGGGALEIRDNFAVSNQFYGGQVGVQGRFCGYRGFSADGLVKFAIGNMRQTVSINGSNSLISPAGVVDTQPTGLYAQSSNSGVAERNKFVILPEFGFNLNYAFTPNALFTIGYNFIYVNHVARAAGSFDPVVNDSTIRYVANPPAGNTPGSSPRFSDESFWMQGLQIGLRLDY